MMKKRFLLPATALLMATSLLNGQQVQVEVENLQTSDGFYFTPVWVGFHGGGFDLFNNNQAASAGLELLAEEGDASVLNGEFAGSGTSGAVTAEGGFTGAPVFDPGEVASAVFDIGENDRYFSFASMIIPSNDAFIGNSDPLEYELFDADGNFNGPITIELFGGDIYDSGTEVNDTLGAAFSAIGGTSTDENGVVGLHTGLGNFLGTDTAAGSTIGVIPGTNSPIARITITATAVPEPSALFGVVCFFGLMVQRRQRI